MADLPQVGELIAEKYRLESVLGQGGMGVVMAAHHAGLGRTVALKFLSNADADPMALQRFLREARLAAQLESEHVARVLDAATLASGVPFIVMEYLRGSNLKQVLQVQGPLPIGLAVDYLIQACDALAEAHALGIVHRDLKPSNLFVSDRKDGRSMIKVLDFGISKMRSTEQGFDTQSTSADVLLGSPRYMAPEQIRSPKNATPRSDIWSLGAILYELLTGSSAYSAETLPGLLAAIVADSPKPMLVTRREVPPGLEALVRRALEKDPAARPRSVAELARALLPFASESSAAIVDRLSHVLGENGRRDGGRSVSGLSDTAPSDTAPSDTAPSDTGPSEPVAGVRDARQRSAVLRALLGLAALVLALVSTVLVATERHGTSNSPARQAISMGADPAARTALAPAVLSAPGPAESGPAAPGPAAPAAAQPTPALGATSAVSSPAPVMTARPLAASPDAAPSAAATSDRAHRPTSMLSQPAPRKMALAAQPLKTTEPRVLEGAVEPSPQPSSEPSATVAPATPARPSKPAHPLDVFSDPQ